MSAGNCPETPRQKMIGMLYLVLLAMLALNVSKDILDVFDLVLKGFDSTIENFNAKNKSVYSAFAEQEAGNPEKVGVWKKKADVVKVASDELYAYIHQLKINLLKETDGKEADTTFQNIEKKDNTSVPANIMLNEKQGKVLKEKIDEYREKVIEIIGEKDTALIATIRSNLSTAPPPMKDGVQLSWEAHNFEHYPLIGVLTILSKKQSDIRNVEADVVSYLFDQIHASSFKFNKLFATVIPKSDYVLKGGTYEAQVFLAAVDTTKYPEVFVGESTKPLEIENGKAVYRVNANSVGEKKWSGIIRYQAPDGSPLNFVFNRSYTVAQPNLVVAPTKMNVFYVGVDNPVSISVPGVPSNKIKATISNGNIQRRGNNFIVKPKAPGKKAIVSVQAEFDGKYKSMGSVDFRVKEVPDPIAKVAGKKGGNIRKNELIAQSGVLADLENFDFDLKFRVTQFSVSMTDNAGYVNEQESNSSRFTNDQKNMMRKLRRNQKVYIENIKAIGPDGKARELLPIVFKVI